MDQTEEKSERDTIIEKYQKGRDKLEKNEIKEWEDPDFSLYQETDRYGFIHGTKLPAKLPEYERKLKAQENSRLNKWLKMIKSWELYYPNSEKLRKRVYKGIPDALRGKVWPKLLNTEQLKLEQEGVYAQMLEYGLECSTDVRQIDLDVNRTYRNHRIFRERYNLRQQMLFRVLVAYSVYNTEIGYCQGMSQIAALLLMHMDEEDAFWCLSTLMSSKPYRMHGFFIPGFPKLTRFSKHHDRVVQKFLPRVSKHFKKFGIDSTLYTLKWFFQCFLDRVPFSLTLRLWDVFLLDGEIILTGMSYTLLKLHKRAILSKSMEETIELLQIELEKDFGYHDDSAIHSLETSIAELRRAKLLTPGDTPDDELPSKEFGKLAFQSRSHLTDDGRSLAGSIQLRQETYSVATSRTSDADSDDDDDRSRSISLYDNVSVNESIEAAKQRSVSRSQNHSTNSNHADMNNGAEVRKNVTKNGGVGGETLLSNNNNHSTGRALSSNNDSMHSSSPTQQPDHRDSSSRSSSRREQTELIEKIAQLNTSAGNSPENDRSRVVVEKTEKTFFIEDHRSEERVTTEYTTTTSTMISVNNFTTHSLHHSSSNSFPVEASSPDHRHSPRYRQQANSPLHHPPPTSPSKIRIFVPYSEHQQIQEIERTSSPLASPVKNSSDPIISDRVRTPTNQTTAKGLPTVET